MNNVSVKMPELPNTPLVKSAVNLVEEVSPRFLYTHCVRTFLFADALGRRDNLKYDRELLCVSALLHDLGLTDEFNRDDRFEVDSADAAKAFVLKHGLAEEKAEIVWDAIAIHTTVAVAFRKQPEIALIPMGTLMDFAGLRLNDLPPEMVEQILAEYPRLGFNRAIIELFVEYLRKKPQVAPITWMAEVVRTYLPDVPCPTFMDYLEGSPYSK